MKRSPSAPRLKPSIVNERGDEAPRAGAWRRIPSISHHPKRSSDHPKSFRAIRRTLRAAFPVLRASFPPLRNAPKRTSSPADPSDGIPSASDHPRPLRAPFPRGMPPERRERRSSSGECHPKSYTDDVPQCRITRSPGNAPRAPGNAIRATLRIVRRKGNAAQNPEKSPKNPRITDTCPARPTPRAESLYEGWEESAETP